VDDKGSRATVWLVDPNFGGSGCPFKLWYEGECAISEHNACEERSRAEKCPLEDHDVIVTPEPNEEMARS